MRKYVGIIILICVFISGCTKTSAVVSSSSTGGLSSTANNETTETCLVPTSYFKFSGYTLESAFEEYSEYVNSYFVSVKQADNGLLLEMTEKQKKDFINRNNEFIEKQLKQFTEHNDMYKYVGDSEYKTLEFYYDEKIPEAIEVRGVWAVVNGYGMNYILKNNTTEWGVHVTIKNCHTGKVVASGTIPNETVSYGENEWKKSYE